MCITNLELISLEFQRGVHNIYTLDVVNMYNWLEIAQLWVGHITENIRQKTF